MNSLKHIFSTVKFNSPILYWIVILHFVFALGCVFGILIDDRILMGINVWIKPFKFSISAGIYIMTVGYLNTFYPFSKIKANLVNNLVSWSIFIEILIILYQASGGVLSHYNQSSLFDGVLFGIMGLLIMLNVLVMAFFVFETIRLKLDTSKSIQWAILIGWAVSLFGSWVGGQMIGAMSHNVGIADGGPGLPLLNWSTIAGDLRVAHFFGLHGLQIIPIFAYLISKKWNTTIRNQIITVSIFGLVYVSWIAFTFYQAKQGMPFI